MAWPNAKASRQRGGAARYLAYALANTFGNISPHEIEGRGIFSFYREITDVQGVKDWPKATRVVRKYGLELGSLGAA